jgi:hypothetical protein
VSDPSGTETRFFERRCKDPRRGGALCGEPQSLPRSRLRRPGKGQARPTRRQGQGRKLRDERGCRGSEHPWRGKSSREDRAGSSFRRRAGNGLPRRSKPGRQARSRQIERGGSVRANARRARLAERSSLCRGRGSLRRAQSQKRYRHETRLEGRGRKKTSRG